MKKHLKVKATLKGKSVEIKILEQTHHDIEFGNSASFFYGSDRTLRLYGTSQEPRLQGKAVCFNGRRMDTFEVPLEFWPLIKVLIAEYNTWGELQ